MNTIDIVVKQYSNTEKLEQLHIEREETQKLKAFQSWCKDMKIGVRYTNREGINRANEMMAQWNNEIDSRMPEWIRRMY